MRVPCPRAGTGRERASTGGPQPSFAFRSAPDRQRAPAGPHGPAVPRRRGAGGPGAPDAGKALQNSTEFDRFEKRTRGRRSLLCLVIHLLLIFSHKGAGLSNQKKGARRCECGCKRAGIRQERPARPFLRRRGDRGAATRARRPRSPVFPLIIRLLSSTLVPSGDDVATLSEQGVGAWIWSARPPISSSPEPGTRTPP